jgi:DNA polymerase-3 subunit epsilon
MSLHRSDDHFVSPQFCGFFRAVTLDVRFRDGVDDRSSCWGKENMSIEWVAIDFETANLSRESACAVGMTLVKNGEIADRFSTYIQPPGDGGFHPFNTSLHGIDAETVHGAPEWPEALAQIVEFTGGRPLISHNAAFDLGVIRNACTATALPWPTLRYACTLVVARRTWQLLTYRLPFVAEAAGVRQGPHHDAQADADAAAEILLAAMRVHGVELLDDLLDTLRIRYGRQNEDTWAGSTHVQPSRTATRRDIPVANHDADPNGLFYGRTVCLTGTLATMVRTDAQRRLAEAGAQAVPGVSKKTDVLVVGMPDPRRFAPGMEVSKKQRKAQELLDKGHRIEMIGEVDFLEWLSS